jgi:hypothetical protein
MKSKPHYYIKEQIQPYTGESLGWDVRERTDTADVCIIPCDTQDEAEAELEKLRATQTVAPANLDPLRHT